MTSHSQFALSNRGHSRVCTAQGSRRFERGGQVRRLDLIAPTADSWSGDFSVMDQTWPNKALEPTRVGALSSAVADGASCSRVAQLGR